MTVGTLNESLDAMCNGLGSTCRLELDLAVANGLDTLEPLRGTTQPTKSQEFAQTPDAILSRWTARGFALTDSRQQSLR